MHVRALSLNSYRLFPDDSLHSARTSHFLVYGRAGDACLSKALPPEEAAVASSTGNRLATLPRSKSRVVATPCLPVVYTQAHAPANNLGLGFSNHGGMDG